MPVWTALARQDLQAQLYALAAENPGDARKMAVTIKVACAGLAQFPKVGAEGPVTGARELAIPGAPYVCVYRVILRRVEILRVLHSRMQWPQ